MVTSNRNRDGCECRCNLQRCGFSYLSLVEVRHLTRYLSRSSQSSRGVDSTFTWRERASLYIRHFVRFLSSNVESCHFFFFNHHLAQLVLKRLHSCCRQAFKRASIFNSFVRSQQANQKTPVLHHTACASKSSSASPSAGASTIAMRSIHVQHEHSDTTG